MEKRCVIRPFVCIILLFTLGVSRCIAQRSLVQDISNKSFSEIKLVRTLAEKKEVVEYFKFDTNGNIIEHFNAQNNKDTLYYYFSSNAKIGTYLLKSMIIWTSDTSHIKRTFFRNSNNAISDIIIKTDLITGDRTIDTTLHKRQSIKPFPFRFPEYFYSGLDLADYFDKDNNGLWFIVKDSLGNIISKTSKLTQRIQSGCIIQETSFVVQYGYNPSGSLQSIETIENGRKIKTLILEYANGLPKSIRVKRINQPEYKLQLVYVTSTEK